MMTKVQNFIEHPPPSLDAGQLRAVRNSAGIAAAILGEQSGEEDWLRWGIDTFRQCVAQSDREAYPERWAMAQNNLGNTLELLGTRESGTGRLDEAAAACRAALEERTRGRVPLDWAMTQINLGNVLQTLGEREPGRAGWRQQSRPTGRHLRSSRNPGQRTM